MSLLKAAPRVIFWYRLFTFGRSPIVVINATEQEGQDAREVLGSHLRSEIYHAISLVNDSKTKANDMDEIINLFEKDENFVHSHLLKDKKLKGPTPFRELERDGILVLIPASTAIGIVLQHSLTKKPSLNELEAMVRPKV